jgi:hypothetical protein
MTTMTGTPQETTIANADLWSKYFQDQWSRWLNPLGLPAANALADGTGARVAGFLALVAAGPIAWLYATQANETEAEAPVALAPAPEVDVDEALELAIAAA